MDRIQILREIIVGIVTSVIFAAATWLVFINRKVKSIPEDTRKMIDELLNERLDHETANHNAVMQVLNPSNNVLHSEHQTLEQQLQFLRDEAIRQQERYSSGGDGITLSQAVALFEGQAARLLAAEQRVTVLQDKIKTLQSDNQRLQNELSLARGTRRREPHRGGEAR
jgi:predicted nuclease with TOPRIM domain